MKYLLLIYANEAAQAQMDPEIMGRLIGEYNEFTTALRSAGGLIAGDALQPTMTATSVRVRGGKTVRTDGPFAETKEHIGGLMIIEAADMAEARALVEADPMTRYATIEIRPEMDVAWQKRQQGR